jgi:ABC-2 type transport system ATP-binding protein
MNTLITANHLHKYYGELHALNEISFSLERGQIVGLLGPNGAGKSTLINAILGLNQFQGDLSVLGFNPRHHRTQMLQKLCFISDVATLPAWLKVKDAITFVEGVHPSFNREKALALLAKTEIPQDKTVKKLSKGMITQLHLALIMAIEADILILDEPTLGLDILHRKQFYSNLINDYYTKNRTILITTHQAEEIEGILTHLMIIDHGTLLLHTDVDSLYEKYLAIEATPDKKAELLALNPLYQQTLLGKTMYLFNNQSAAELSRFGSLSRPSISDIFVAIVTEKKS